MKCPHCGKEIPEESSFCLYCGKSTKTQKKPKKSKVQHFTKTLTNSDIKYSILHFGKSLSILPDTKLKLTINGRVYTVSSSKNVEGRIVGLSKIYNSFGLKVGDEVNVEYKPFNNELTLTIPDTDEDEYIDELDDEDDLNMVDLTFEGATAVVPTISISDLVDGPGVPNINNINKYYTIKGSHSKLTDQVVENGRYLEVVTSFDDRSDFDTDPMHSLFGNIDICLKGPFSDLVVKQLSSLKAYKLISNGLFIVTSTDDIYFINMKGIQKFVGRVNNIISINKVTQIGMEVEVFLSLTQLGYNKYRETMGNSHEEWYDTYCVHTAKRFLHFK